MDEELRELRKSVLKTGTTTLGLVCKEGVVLAADKRATIGNGSFIAHKKMDKILPITNKISATTAGSVSDVQLLVKLTKAELRLKHLRTKIEPNVIESANLFAMFTYQNIRKFSPLIGVTAFLVAGSDTNGFWLFEISPDGSVVRHEDFVSTGSGMVVAYGVLEDIYKSNITVDEGIKLAVKALNAAMQRDTPTGSGLDVVVIDKKGVKQILKEEVKQVLVKR